MPEETIPLPVSWGALTDAEPQMAAFGRERLDGQLAYFATIAGSGWPRIHPVTTIIAEGRCCVFADAESAKVSHLSRSSLCSLHRSLADSSGSSGEFRIRGHAQQLTDLWLRERIEAECNFRPSSKSLLFELRIVEAVMTKYRHGNARHVRWRPV